MARLPTRDNLSGPNSLRSGRAIAAADTSAIGRGLQSFGQSINRIGEDRYQQEAAVDLARAEAYKTQEFIAAENEFANDPDYATVGTRAQERTGGIVQDAGNLIRDPVLRERWLVGAGTDAAVVTDRVFDQGQTLQRQAEVNAFDEALEVNRRIYVDPNSSEEARQRARADIEGALQVGLQSGLLTPDSEAARRQTYLVDADYNRGLLAVDAGQFDGPIPTIPTAEPTIELEFTPAGKPRDPDTGFLMDEDDPRYVTKEAYDAARASSSGASTADAAGLLRQFEGFRTAPYWDVNAYRIGYGSDTITREDGSVVRVRPGMTVTQADAERDLTRRMAEFEKVAIANVGQAAWDRLPPNAKAALLSTTYNYGELPGRIREAVKSGDTVQIAQAVAALGTDNGGVNKSRRAKEAAIIAGQSNPDWYQRLSPEQRAVVSAKGVERSKELATALKVQQDAAYTAHKEAVGLGILTGSVVSEQEILGDTMLTAGDQATLLRSLRSEQGATAQARNYLAALGSDGGAALNPYNSDDTALAGKAYDLLMSSVPEDQKPTATAMFVQQSGIVPKPVVADVRQSLASNDPAMVATGLTQAAALFDTAPMALDSVENGAELRAAAATYAELVGGRGLSVDQAAQHVIAMRDPANVAKAEVLEKAWDQAVKDNKFVVNDVLAAFDPSPFPGGPSAGLTPAQEAGLAADYLAAAERAFTGQANGDVGIARQIALAEMKRTYGVTRSGGTETVMKYPPENFYPPINGSQDYIRDMALSDARGIDPNASNVMLLSGSETAADIRAGNPPRYNLMYQRPDGVWDMAPGMFMVDAPAIQNLSANESAYRAERFAIERAYESELAALPQAGGLRANGGMSSAEIVQARREITQRRDAALAEAEARASGVYREATGAPVAPAPAPTPPVSDDAAMEAERLWQEQNAATFGMMGGSQ